MNSTLLTIYVMVWPVIVAIVLVVVATAFFREWAKARREGRDLV